MPIDSLCACDRGYFANQADTRYEVFASLGGLTRGGALPPDPSKIRKIAETSENKYEHQVRDRMIAIVYKVRAIRNGVVSEFSDPYIQNP